MVNLEAVVVRALCREDETKDESIGNYNERNKNKI